MPITHLTRLHSTIVSGGVAINAVDENGLVTPINLQSAAQPIIDVFDDSVSAQASFDNTQARTTANDAIDNNKDALHKLLRAVASIMVDELNILRQWEMSFKAEVAAATSLADLKTRVATLPNLPDRTLVQAKTSIKNAVNAGSVD